MHRIAFLHLEYLAGKVEKNRQLIEKGIAKAIGVGAHWIITPECAVSGYFFLEEIGADWISPQPDCWMEKMLDLAKAKNLTLFLGCPEKDPQTNLLYNSLFVLGSEGKILARHRKHRVVGRAEAWATAGSDLQPFQCDPVKVGLLICADSWHADKVEELKSKGAELLIVSAAWPPGPCGPGDCWEKRTGESGLPLWLCNQTGSQSPLDFTQADSVIAAGGKRLLEKSLSESGILIFDWDMESMSLLSEDFQVIEMD